MTTLTPAYGRDYKSAKEAKAAFADDRDWLVNDLFSPWDGKPVNRSQLRGQKVLLRFHGNRKTAVVTA